MNFLKAQEVFKDIIAEKLFDFKDIIRISLTHPYLTSSNTWVSGVKIRDTMGTLITEFNIHVKKEKENEYGFPQEQEIRKQILKYMNDIKRA